jgi:hypothetical protein
VARKRLAASLRREKVAQALEKIGIELLNDGVPGVRLHKSAGKAKAKQ